MFYFIYIGLFKLFLSYKDKVDFLTDFFGLIFFSPIFRFENIEHHFSMFDLLLNTKHKFKNLFKTIQ